MPVKACKHERLSTSFDQNTKPVNGLATVTAQTFVGVFHEERTAEHDGWLA